MEPVVTNTTTPETKSDWNPNEVQAVVLPQVESVSPVSTEETVTNMVSEELPIQEAAEVIVSNSTTEALSVQPPVAESTFTPRAYTELNEPSLPLGISLSDLQPKVETPQTPAQEVLLPVASAAKTETKTGAWNTIKSFLSFGKKS